MGEPAIQLDEIHPSRLLKKVQEVLPEENLWIKMKYLADEQRSMMFVPHGRRFESMVEKLRNDVIKSF